MTFNAAPCFEQHLIYLLACRHNPSAFEQACDLVRQLLILKLITPPET